MSVSLQPIGPWFLVIVAAVGVTVLTVWAYQQRLRGTQGAWRWFALGLRLAAILLCVIAALRPSIIYQEKKKQSASIVFLIDGSTSMQLTDEAGGKSRWNSAVAVLSKARAVAEKLGKDVSVKTFRFDSSIREQPANDTSEPNGKETAIGSALNEAVKRQEGTRIASMILLADGANNAGMSPLAAARSLRSQQIPVVTVGFGSETAGAASRDVSVRDLVTPPSVHVKNHMLIRGSVVARGFANKLLDVELYVEGQAEPVAKTQVKVPEGTEVVPITGLKYSPQTPGEKKLTLKVKEIEGELIRSNNEVSTYVTVLAGGLNVLYVQGPHSPWEHKFLMRAIKMSPDIQADLRIVRRSAEGDRGELDNEDFAPGRYNVYILSDVAADHLTRMQQALLARAVERGAGLIMLGGRSSFGAGGWADTEVARVLPVKLHPGDGQLEPEDGLTFAPMTSGLENFLFQVGKDRTESKKIWLALPPLSGANRLEPKVGATVLAQAAGGRTPPPLMVASETGAGRSMAFGGETWVWARASDEGRAAHRKFWRQVIFWLSHKEDQGDNKVDLSLDRRRVSVGQKIEMTVTARDSKNAPIPDVTYRAEVLREGATTAPESIDVYTAGDQAKGSYPVIGQPGEYKVKVTAFRDGKELGHDDARFLVYQDDREMENPAADLAQLRQIAEMTGGQSLLPEKLASYLKGLDGKTYTESVTQTERKLWDNWPFFLIFTTLLTLEWWLRKRNGWV